MKKVGAAKIPKNFVEVKCRDCDATFRISRKVLYKRCKSCDGYCPCDSCGSHATSWEFGMDED